MSDETLIERYFERAAILEYDGGLSRYIATKSCFVVLETWCKKIGREVPQVVRDDFETIEREHLGNGKAICS